MEILKPLTYVQCHLKYFEILVCYILVTILAMSHLSKKSVRIVFHKKLQQRIIMY